MRVRALRWLLPGLRVKRWLALFTLGIAMAAIGALLVHADWGRHHVDIGADLVLLIAGVVLAPLSVRQLITSVVTVLLPEGTGEIADTYWRSRALLRGPRVVALGGGTGLPVMLRGIKQYTSNITAIVAVTDDGGSSGRLRGELGVPPPGDLRNCLLALAETEPLMEQLFQYRFEAGEGLSGHAFGNLFLAAMCTVTGDLQDAIRASSRILAVRGQVLPATDDQVTLRAELSDGRVIRGESRIPEANGQILKVALEPADAAPTQEALRAIAQADVILLSPGSLFTSLMPNLLVQGIADAIRRSPALRVYVQNIMTQPGETDGMSAEQHLEAITRHAGSGLVDCVVLNTQPLPPEVAERYLAGHSEVVSHSDRALSLAGYEVIAEPLLAEGSYARHDSQLVARAILNRWAKRRRPEPGRLLDLLLLREHLRSDSR
ncbi:MAG: YvcK family protein [Thermaerobacter sp.]|nr:YvcK family protein [Thermaerobacter sp.]